MALLEGMGQSGEGLWAFGAGGHLGAHTERDVVRYLSVGVGFSLLMPSGPCSWSVHVG